MAHIHQGKIGQNGPVVVTLFNASSPTGPKSGILARNAYANVHTQQNPKGEIRGQIQISK